jgi:hypothetical protein
VSTRSHLFRAPWLRLVGVWLMLSAAIPVPPTAGAEVGAAAAARAERQQADRNDIDYTASLADNMVEQVAPLCLSPECAQVYARLALVTGRQRALLGRSGLTPARLRQVRKVLMVAIGDAIAAFEADYPEYRDRIERKGKFATLSVDELSARSDVQSTFTSPDSLSSSVPSVDFGGVTADTTCVDGCSKSACRTRCTQLATNFGFICAAYAFVCPICASICLLTLAYQLNKCNNNCDATCKNP